MAKEREIVEKMKPGNRRRARTRIEGSLAFLTLLRSSRQRILYLDDPGRSYVLQSLHDALGQRISTVMRWSPRPARNVPAPGSRMA